MGKKSNEKSTSNRVPDNRDHSNSDKVDLSWLSWVHNGQPVSFFYTREAIDRAKKK